MVHLTQKDHGKVWNIVKQSRIKYFKYNPGGYEKDCPFRMINGILSEAIIRLNIQNVENSLNFNESETKTYGDVNSLALQTAAEMFIYLTHCPSPEYYKLIDFMEYLLTSESPSKIILAMTSIMTNVKKQTSIKIFNYIMKRFDLHEYETIKKMVTGPNEVLMKQLKSNYSESSKVLGFKTYCS